MPPWWLLTHYPDTNDVFSYLDGVSILLYISATTAVIGGSIMAGLWLAGRIIKSETIIPWHLGYSLTPLASTSVFMGLTALTISMLKAEHITLDWVEPMRISLMLIGYSWMAYLLWQKTTQINKLQWLQRLSAWVVILVGTIPVGLSWYIMFYVW